LRWIVLKGGTYLIGVKDCQLLITCCNQNGGLFLINFYDQQYEVKKILDGEFRGIAKFGNFYVLVSGSKGIFILDKTFNVINHKQITGKLDFHGVSVYKDKAYIVETKTNSIGVYDLQENIEKIDEIRLSNENHDVCHVNDLFIRNDILYVSMFSYPNNISKNSFLFRHFLQRKPTEQGLIIAYSLKGKKIIGISQDKLFQPHSVLIHDNQLYYCVSAKFLVKKNEEVIFNCYGYTRGLAIKDQIMFIGQSKSRNLDVLTKEHTNVMLNCGIYIHDISSRQSFFVEIPANEIYGILVV
jgi:hypothetical protein